MSPGEEAGVAYCTIASANYLHKVQTLLTSFRRYHQDGRFEILLCESPELCRRISAEIGYRLWSPEDICPSWREMAFYYDVIEFNTALKPFFMERLLDSGATAVIYLDPDIEIYSTLTSIEDHLRSHDVVLTPHACKPVPQDGLRPSMDEYIRAGQFNLGFIGMGNTSSGRDMLRWWQGVCREQCLFDPSHRYFVDQFWAAAFASLADRLYVLRDPGCNVAYWNVFQRVLLRAGEQWKVDGEPLKFFHFSGLMEEDLTKVSRYQNRVVAPEGSALHQLLAGYVARVVTMPWSRYLSTPYSFRCYEKGHTIAAGDRRRFLYLSAEERALIGDPFCAEESIRGIVTITISGSPKAYIARVRGEAYVRILRSMWDELVHKVRTRGIWETVRLILRLLRRKLAGDS